MSFLSAREHGAKPGSGGVASAQNEAIDRRERLRRLALETIDLAKDPYYMRNHLGQVRAPPAVTVVEPARRWQQLNAEDRDSRGGVFGGEGGGE
jgi:hypothetical protein